MQTCKQCITALVALVLVLTLGSVISAHHVWLNASRYNLDLPKEGKVAETALYFGWGDYFPVHDFLTKDRVQSLKLLSPNGETTAIEPGADGFLSVKVKLPVQGTYLAIAELTPGYVSHVVVDSKDQHIRKPKNEVPAGAKMIESKYSVQTAKAILNLGEAGSQDAAALRPAGQEIEIVALKHPMLCKEGDKFPFQVLLKGKPLHGQKDVTVMKATYLGFSTKDEGFAVTGTVDENGMGKIKLQKAGIWQIWVTHRAEAGEDMKDKADAISYGCTLTFEIP